LIHDRALRRKEKAMTLVPRAELFAIVHHGEQLRRYTEEPYWHHPHAVMMILSGLGFREEVLAAALLHDLVEDRDVKPEQIREAFGPDVERLVMEVTDESIKPEHKGKNRKTRKGIDREHLAKASAEGQSIKVADLIDNTTSIVKYDPDFAVVYLREKRELLEVLTQAHPELLRRAREQIDLPPSVA
jgi:(p)ppGpp synthase/HD superfamily hydrolase